jgi:hypothetical protein
MAPPLAVGGGAATPDDDCEDDGGRGVDAADDGLLMPPSFFALFTTEGEVDDFDSTQRLTCGGGGEGDASTFSQE